MKLAAVIFGAAIGASARYFLNGAITASSAGVFPWGTLAVNLTGCLVMGFLWGMAERGGWSPEARSFLFVGILGSYTTFSSFGIETFTLFRAGHTGEALLYALASNLGGLLLVWGGFRAAHLPA